MAQVSTEPARDPGAAARPGWAAVLKAAALLLLIGLAVWYLVGHELPTVDDVRAFVGRFGGWGVLVFAVAYTLVGATPVPVTVMGVAGGFLFGMAQGSVLGIVASTAGAWLGYWAARFLGRDVLHRIAGRRIAAVEARLAGKGFLSVLVLRPVLPHWALSYGAGLVRIPQRDYLGATLLGGMPGQLSFAAVGAFASRPSGPALAVVAAAWTVLVLVGALAWRRARREGAAAPGARPVDPGGAGDGGRPPGREEHPGPS